MSITPFRRSAPRVALAALAGGIACLTLIAPVAAASEAPCMTVSYRDLDLATSAGAATLYRRIAGAAREVCGERGYGLFFEGQWNSCYRAAVAGAVAAVNSPLLSDLHHNDKRPGKNVTALAIW